MYSSFQLTKKYLGYYFTAFNGKGHGMHSPFVFDFILQVLNNKNNMEAPAEIEALRQKLRKDKRKVEILELGAGSRSGAATFKTVGQLARTALKPEKYAQVLYRLAKYYRPVNIIELGTSLGLTAAYLSKGNPGASVTTIEGNPAVASLAREVFKKLDLTNIRLLEGNFDTVLPGVLAGGQPVDLGYIDGNHRYEPTMYYFHQFLSCVHHDSILVFDDIHWSGEMERAWNEIKEHPAVACTADIFFLGFVFFRKEFRVKQNFTIRF